MSPFKPRSRTPGSRESDTLLTNPELSKCVRADDVEEAEDFCPAVPTRHVSNGEYMPLPQSDVQKRVEARTRELADMASKKLGVHRRTFLSGAGGLAASSSAMNEVHGAFFKVDEREMFRGRRGREGDESDRGDEFDHGAPRNLFVLDDQLHVVRGSNATGGRSLRAIAQGPSTPGFTSNPFNPDSLPDENGNVWGVWNPALVGMPLTAETFHVVQWMKDIWFDSQVTVGLVSNVTASIFRPEGGTPRPPKNISESLQAELLTAEQTVAVRNFVNRIANSERCLAHGLAVHRRRQCGLHPVPDRELPSGLVEGLLHLQCGQGGQRSREPDAAMAARRRERRLPDLRGDRAQLRQGAPPAPRLQQHLRPQGPGDQRGADSRARAPHRHPEGRTGLAEPELRDLPLLHQAGVLRLQRVGRHPLGPPARWRARHPVDHRVLRCWRSRSATSTARSGRPWLHRSSPSRPSRRTSSASCSSTWARIASSSDPIHRGTATRNGRSTRCGASRFRAGCSGSTATRRSRSGPSARSSGSMALASTASSRSRGRSRASAPTSRCRATTKP